MNRSALLSMSLATALLLNVGCESVPNGDAPPLIVLEQLDAGETVTAAMTHIESTGVRTFRISGGNDDGALIKRETTGADRFDAKWMTVESIVTDAGPMPRRTEYWSIDDDGNAVLHATVDHEEEAITLFKPPMVTMPAELSPGDERTFESQVRIVAEDDITRQKESGTATQVMMYDGSSRMRTALGEVTVAVVKIEFEADLAMADAIETTVRYIDVTHGIIAIERTRKVKILGLGGSEHRETLQLLSAK